MTWPLFLLGVASSLVAQAIYERWRRRRGQ
jgi:hypothetical protein